MTDIEDFTDLGLTEELYKILREMECREMNIRGLLEGYLKSNGL